jgi:hypothetical protein
MAVFETREGKSGSNKGHLYSIEEHAWGCVCYKFAALQPQLPGISILAPQGEFLIQMNMPDKALEAWYQRLRADRVRAVKLSEKVPWQRKKFIFIRVFRKRHISY